ncbi:helix-turn-helix transcriptional regulator [Halalkalibacter krulwichiae]|uniref:HTH-type transcriptional activator RhaR n=1 Tax=Halalkalibacter krulwichiae TaxID=199441 RepID=A0A1X9MCC8_9BACI|nr:helix-turn-helix domain-containing protein [Halalkalibacter krulwichiae]ARK29793.1 HTH-type transcriptional activator RhaR [Halalkalibacter krulwichiae]
MNESQIISTSMKIHYITNLNVYVLNQDGDLFYENESISIPMFMPGNNAENVKALYEIMTEDGEEEIVYSYINEWGLHYFGRRFRVLEQMYTIIIGPYFERTPNHYRLTIDYQLSNDQSQDLRVVCEKVHVLSGEQANSFASVLGQFRALLDQKLQTKIIVADKNKRSIKDQMNHIDEDAELVNVRYKIEKEFIYAVEQGDKKTALKLMNSSNMSTLFSFSERFPNQPLRRLKNLAIVLNTLLRTAARTSKVSSILIHRISEKYAFEIEQASQLTTLYKLEERMIEEYCDLILSNSLKKYSTLTQKIIEHLLSSYDKPLNKEELASIYHTHPSHLSRKFKQETSYTLSGYHQMLRLNKAKHLLKNENLSIEDISWVVGYEDSSYFARVFKKETGMTPSQFREEET